MFHASAGGVQDFSVCFCPGSSTKEGGEELLLRAHVVIIRFAVLQC